jgi:hypothetical protein
MDRTTAQARLSTAYSPASYLTFPHSITAATSMFSTTQSGTHDSRNPDTKKPAPYICLVSHASSLTVYSFNLKTHLGIDRKKGKRL